MSVTLHNKLKISTTLILVLVFPLAIAAPPMYSPVLTADTAGKKGMVWEAKVYHDPHTTQHFLVPLKICFQYTGDQVNPFDTPPIVSTQDKYTWCNKQFGWKGVASKEGDQIFMNSNIKSSYISSVQWEISSKNEGAGHWRAWNNNQLFDLNVVFTRTSETCSCE